jgi:hypothetical protein
MLNPIVQHKEILYIIETSHSVELHNKKLVFLMPVFLLDFLLRHSLASMFMSLVYAKLLDQIEINFLCVYAKLLDQIEIIFFHVHVHGIKLLASSVIKGCLRS